MQDLHDSLLAEERQQARRKCATLECKAHLFKTNVLLPVVVDALGKLQVFVMLDVSGLAARHNNAPDSEEEDRGRLRSVGGRLGPPILTPNFILPKSISSIKYQNFASGLAVGFASIALRLKCSPPPHAARQSRTDRSIARPTAALAW